MGGGSPSGRGSVTCSGTGPEVSREPLQADCAPATAPAARKREAATPAAPHCAHRSAQDLGGPGARKPEAAGCSLVLLPALICRLVVCDTPLAHRLVHCG